MFKEIQKLFSLERLETLYLVAARSDAIDARRSRYDATTYQDWFLILPFLSFTTIQFRYQTRQNSPCPAVSKNILYWYFSRYSVLFLFSMMTVSSVHPGQVHSEALKFMKSSYSRNVVFRQFSQFFLSKSQSLCFVLLDCGTQSSGRVSYVRIGYQSP